MAIPTRTGPPVTENHPDWKVLSVGGWWIKVNVEGTSTQEIAWIFGKSPASLWWHKSWERPRTHGGPIPEHELYPGNLPASGWIELQPLRVIYVRATTKEEADSASFCVFYQQQAVARVDFIGETTVKLDAARHEPRCAP